MDPCLTTISFRTVHAAEINKEKTITMKKHSVDNADTERYSTQNIRLDMQQTQEQLR